MNKAESRVRTPDDRTVHNRYTAGDPKFIYFHGLSHCVGLLLGARGLAKRPVVNRVGMDGEIMSRREDEKW